MESKLLTVPWLAQTAGDCIEIHGYKRVVAVVRGVDDEAIDISRLIEAAPELLAAAQDIIMLLLPVDSGAKKYWDNLKAAIAKAKEAK